jgi:hypothetical protein
MATFPSKVDYATGDILTADNMNEIGGELNLLESAQYAAGKNKIINGDFGVWARGTSFSNPSGTYTADRFLIAPSTAVPTYTVSQQTFTPGTAPVAGYESTFFLRVDLTNQNGSTRQAITQRIEDVRTLAGQTVTFSFYAKANSSNTLGLIRFGQNFGSGGSAAVETTITLNSTALTTSWTRYTGSITVPSVAGKTIGTSSYVYLFISAPTTATYTLDIWGWQLEAGSTASNFQTATGTIQGELAACMRYFQKSNDIQYPPGDTTANGIRTGFFTAAVAAARALQTTLPVRMRTAPTVTYYSNNTGASGNVRNVTTVADIAVSSQGAIGETSIGFPTLASAPGAADAFSFHYSASSEL